MQLLLLLHYAATLLLHYAATLLLHYAMTFIVTLCNDFYCYLIQLFLLLQYVIIIFTVTICNDFHVILTMPTYYTVPLYDYLNKSISTFVKSNNKGYTNI